MAVTCATGTVSTVGVGASGQTVPSGTFVDLGGLVSATVMDATNLSDFTNNDDGGYTSKCVGNRSMSLSFELRYDFGDPAQATLFAAKEGTNLQAYRVRTRIGSGTQKEYSFEGRIESWEESIQNGDPVGVSVTVQSTGAITSSTQS